MKQNKHTTQTLVTAIPASVALKGTHTHLSLLLAKRRYITMAKEKQYNLTAKWLFNKEWLKEEAAFGGKNGLPTYLFPFWGLKSPFYLLLLLQSDVSAAWLICSFICMVSQAKPSVPPLMKASISPTNKRRRKHGVRAGLSRSLH